MLASLVMLVGFAVNSTAAPARLVFAGSFAIASTYSRQHVVGRGRVYFSSGPPTPPPPPNAFRTSRREDDDWLGHIAASVNLEQSELAQLRERGVTSQDDVLVVTDSALQTMGLSLVKARKLRWAAGAGHPAVPPPPTSSGPSACRPVDAPELAVPIASPTSPQQQAEASVRSSSVGAAAERSPGASTKADPVVTPADWPQTPPPPPGSSGSSKRSDENKPQMWDQLRQMVPGMCVWVAYGIYKYTRPPDGEASNEPAPTVVESNASDGVEARAADCAAVGEEDDLGLGLPIPSGTDGRGWEWNGWTGAPTKTESDSEPSQEICTDPRPID